MSVVAVVSLVAIGCGRSNSRSSTTTTSRPTGTTAKTVEQGLASGDFGDLKKVCGPKPANVKLTASDVGVTDRSIQVSTFSDPGFSGRPGLNQEFFDTATAFANWCNSLGGINGRKIDLKLRDAAFTQYQQRMSDACAQRDFMMVGGGGVLDDTGQKDRLACGLPTIAGFVVTSTAAGADLTVQPVPNAPNEVSDGEFVALQHKFPGSDQAIGVLAGNISTTEIQAKKYGEAMKSLGFTTVYNQTFNAVGEPTWRPFAEAIKSAKVKGLVWVGEPIDLAKLMQAFVEIGYKLDWVRADVNHYDQNYLAEGGPAVDGTFIRSSFYPFLDPAEAAKNPATNEYRQLMAKFKPGGKIAYLGLQGFSAWLLFAVAVRDCGSNVTRDCVFAKARDHTNWTGGGLHSPSNVKDNEVSDCYALLGVQGGSFVLQSIAANDGIYRCDKSGVFKLGGDYGIGAKCPNPAFAADPKPSKCVSG